MPAADGLRSGTAARQQSSNPVSLLDPPFKQDFLTLVHTVQNLRTAAAAEDTTRSATQGLPSQQPHTKGSSSNSKKKNKKKQATTTTITASRRPSTQKETTPDHADHLLLPLNTHQTAHALATCVTTLHRIQATLYSQFDHWGHGLASSTSLLEPPNTASYHNNNNNVNPSSRTTTTALTTTTTATHASKHGIIANILLFCDFDSLIRVARVNTIWYHASMANDLWKMCYLRRFGLSTALSPRVALDGVLTPWRARYLNRLFIHRNWNKGRYDLCGLKAHRERVFCLAFDPVYLVTGAKNAFAKVWLRDSGMCVGIMRGHTAAITALDFGARFVLTASADKTARLWSFVDKDNHGFHKVVCVLGGHTKMLTAARLSPSDHNQCATASMDGTIRIWSISAAAAASSATTKNKKKNKKTNVTMDATHVVIQAHKGGVRCLQYIEDADSGTYIVSGGNDATIRVWDATAPSHKEPLVELTEHSQPISAFQMLGKLLVSSSDDGSVRFWNMKTAECYRVFRPHGAAGVRTMHFDDERLITAGADCQICVWDLRSLRCLAQQSLANPAKTLDHDKERIIVGGSSTTGDLLMFDFTKLRMHHGVVSSLDGSSAKKMRKKNENGSQQRTDVPGAPVPDLESDDWKTCGSDTVLTALRQLANARRGAGVAAAPASRSAKLFTEHETLGTSATGVQVAFTGDAAVAVERDGDHAGKSVPSSSARNSASGASGDVREGQGVDNVGWFSRWWSPQKQGDTAATATSSEGGGLNDSSATVAGTPGPVAAATVPAAVVMQNPGAHAAATIVSMDTGESSLQVCDETVAQVGVSHVETETELCDTALDLAMEALAGVWPGTLDGQPVEGVMV